MNGWIKLHRKITEWEWFKTINTRLVFEYLLLSANVKDTRYKGQNIPRGSVATKVCEISKANGLTDDEVRTAMRHLKKTGEITVNATNKCSVINIVKYDVYQACPESDSRTSTNQNTNNSQTNADQNTSTSQPIAEPLPNLEKEFKNLRIQECESDGAPADSVIVFGEFLKVRLTASQHKELVDCYGKSKATDYIHRLDRHIASSSRSYADHYATIKKWIHEDGKKRQTKGNSFVNYPQREWDYAKLEQLERQYLYNSAYGGEKQ